MANEILDREWEIPASIPCDSPVTDYLRGKTIFLTGGTGFLGYLFIEKLLRIEVKKLYLLIRPKKNKTTEQRLNELLESPVFKRLKKERPDFREHIRIVEGFLQEKNFGINNACLEELNDNVDVVIHSASDVRFALTAYEIMKINVGSTFQLLEMCKNMKKLEVFLYMSTAFSQNRVIIDDEFYPPEIEPDTVLKYVGMYETDPDQDILNIVAMKFLNNDENTYMLSKGVCEALVQKYGEYFPVAVMRPSMVFLTHHEPIPYWVDKNSTLALISAGVLAGLIKCVGVIKKGVNTPVVCADMVISAALCIVWYTGTEYNKTIFTPKVYNYSNKSSKHCFIAGRNMFKLIVETGRKTESTKRIWYPVITFCETELGKRIFTLLYDVIPATLMDLFIANKNVSLLKMIRISAYTLTKSNNIMCRQFQFGHKNLDKIYHSMTLYDRFFYQFNTETIDWRHFMEEATYGMRAYLLKEPIESLQHDQNSKRTKILKLVHYFIKYAILITFVFLVWTFYADRLDLTSFRSKLNRLIFVNDGTLKLY